MAKDDLVFQREELVGAEQSVIGSMLIDDKTVGLVVAALSDTDFTMNINRVLFRAVKALYLNNRVIDPVTILDEAGMSGDSSVRTYMLQLMDTTATASNINEYIALTRENSRKVRLRDIGRQMQELVHSEDGLPLLQEGMRILSEQGKDDEADMAKCTLEFYEEIERVTEYFPWVFLFMDDTLLAERKHFAIVAGRPSDGKTSLALHMAYTQAEKYNVGFFSLETGRNSLYTRLMSSVSGVANADIRRRNLHEQEYSLIAVGAGRLQRRHLTIVEAYGWTVEQIEARAMARKFDIVYIDYLQLISASRTGRSTRQDDVADISRSLANMARNHNIMVVALSQLSRQAKGERHEPVMSDLRESGQIEQDADEIMFVWRKDETSSDSERVLTLAKNKEGKLGTWGLVFNGALHRFIPDLSGVPQEKKKKEEPEYKQVSLKELPSWMPTPFDAAENK